MKNPTPVSAGKILRHGNGAGVPSPDDVNQRARENALIDGRKEIREEDYAQAREELRGNTLPDSPTKDETVARSATRDPAEPISDSGHEVLPTETVDENESDERLVTEGVEEAQHDQMVAARRRRVD
jgi:hypothetical protein